MSAPPAISVGILGTGRMAMVMAGTILRHPRARLVAVAPGSNAPGGADRARFFVSRLDLPAAQVRAGPETSGPAVHDDVTALVADSAVRLVYVACRTRDHARLSILALEAGKAVLCEKPFALTSAEAARVTAAARASGGFFMEAMWTPFLPAHRRLAELVTGGGLGAPRHLSFDFGYPVDAAGRAQLTAPEDGGVLFDRAGYGVALALRLLGPVSGLDARGWPEGPRPDTVTLQLHHERGGLSQIAVSAGALLRNAVTVGFEAGAAGLEPPSLAAEAVWSRAHPPGPVGAPGGPQSEGLRARLRRQPALRRLHRLLAGARPERLPYGPDPYALMLEAVLASLARREKGCAEVPVVDSVETVRLLETAAVRIAGTAP